MTVRKTDYDWILVTLAFMTSVIGLVAIYSINLTDKAAKIGPIPTEPLKQGGLLLIGLVAFLIAQAAPSKMVKTAVLVSFWLSLAGVAATFTPLGAEINGQRLWLKIGFLQLQPSEFLKAAVILMAGITFTTRGAIPEVKRLPRDFADFIALYALPRLWHARPILLGVLGAFVVLLQKDFGTSFVILVSVFAMHMVSGASLRSVGFFAAALCITGVFGVALAGYRMKRIPDWKDRWEKGIRDDGGFQQTRSEAALGRGALAGVGLARGAVKDVLPVGSSDMVLATVGEEGGLLGSLLILISLGGVSFCMFLRSASDDSAARVAWTGVGTWIILQTFINFGMANAMLPVVGLPLPFVSTGGSTLLALWATMGALMALSTVKTARREAGETRSDWRGNGRTRLSRA